MSGTLRIEFHYSRPLVDGDPPAVITSGTAFDPDTGLGSFVLAAASEAFEDGVLLSALQADADLAVIDVGALDLGVGARLALALEVDGTAGETAFADVFYLVKASLDGIAGYTPVYAGRLTGTAGALETVRGLLSCSTAVVSDTGAIEALLLDSAAPADSGTVSDPAFGVWPGISAAAYIVVAPRKGTGDGVEVLHAIMGR